MIVDVDSSYLYCCICKNAIVRVLQYIIEYHYVYIYKYNIYIHICIIGVNQREWNWSNSTKDFLWYLKCIYTIYQPECSNSWDVPQATMYPQMSIQLEIFHKMSTINPQKSIWLGVFQTFPVCSAAEAPMLEINTARRANQKKATGLPAGCCCRTVAQVTVIHYGKRVIYGDIIRI